MCSPSTGFSKKPSFEGSLWYRRSLSQLLWTNSTNTVALNHVPGTIWLYQSSTSSETNKYMNSIFWCILRHYVEGQQSRVLNDSGRKTWLAGLIVSWDAPTCSDKALAFVYPVNQHSTKPQFSCPSLIPLCLLKSLHFPIPLLLGDALWTVNQDEFLLPSGEYLFSAQPLASAQELMGLLISQDEMRRTFVRVKSEHWKAKPLIKDEGNLVSEEKKRLY